jgi:cbb3-type cytochrome oxidase subunit 3
MEFNSIGLTNVFLSVIAIISLAILFMLYRLQKK